MVPGHCKTWKATIMLRAIIQRIGSSLRSCCSNLKAYLLTRRFFDPRNCQGLVSERDILFDLSDKTTFFAWQRNHMANERTFLAWCRTGISLIAFGFVIERFDILIHEMRFYTVIPSMPIHMPSTRFMGITAFGLGTLIILLAGWRFFYIRRLINKGDTGFSVLPDVFLMGSVFATVSAAFFFFAFFF